MDSEPPCSCVGPGLCQRFSINQSEYAYGVCFGKGSTGHPCTPEKSEAYRRKWRLKKDSLSAQPKPTQSRQPTRTIHLSNTSPPSKLQVTQPSLAEMHGPGTHLKRLLSELGINVGSDCSCNSRARQMNEWGVDGCRTNRREIVDWLSEEEKRRGWMDKLGAGFKAVALGGSWFKPLDHLGSIVDESIRRSEVALREHAGHSSSNDTL